MKAIGIVRELDQLGRIVLPVETRHIMGLKAKDPVEIYLDDDKIVLKKYEPGCMFCGDVDNTVSFGGKLICKDCYERMRKSFEA
ncbi:MAG: AbrB/MazE/SpoVT family DNA-binding domain-containing protein [Firmicutes bacterium]|nr:AbrB/MazE/SpoVT family DNA-binding domain-containing protein [Bacillota bacterium]